MMCDKSSIGNVRREKMEDEKQVEKDRQRAEVFDALGHPTRILILKVLSEGSLGFADLKKKTAIESSGHLQHHLNKLNSLIKTDGYGKYCLTEQGKDALLTVQTVEHASAISPSKEKTRRQFNNKPRLKSIGLILAVTLLIASFGVIVFQYNQIVNLNNEKTFFISFTPEATSFYNEFGRIIPIVNVNSSFAPPISVYQALQIAFVYQGLNKEALKGMVVYADLEIGETVNFTATGTNGKTWISNSTNVVQQVTTPVGNYSDFSVNGTNYEYLWVVQTHYSNSRTIPPLGFTLTLIDASTGQIFQAPPVG
jgi:DNA-binding HxlR family transcriptional regulator